MVGVGVCWPIDLARDHRCPDVRERRWSPRRGRRSRRRGCRGWLDWLHRLESSITAGLCILNRGGSGDLEVLPPVTVCEPHFICTNFLSSGRRYCAGYR